MKHGRLGLGCLVSSALLLSLACEAAGEETRS
jgi:hypothetical protein